MHSPQTASAVPDQLLCVPGEQSRPFVKETLHISKGVVISAADSDLKGVKDGQRQTKAPCFCELPVLIVCAMVLI